MNHGSSAAQQRSVGLVVRLVDIACRDDADSC